jgi:hypothetical protein
VVIATITSATTAGAALLRTCLSSAERIATAADGAIAVHYGALEVRRGAPVLALAVCIGSLAVKGGITLLSGALRSSSQCHKGWT